MLGGDRLGIRDAQIRDGGTQRLAELAGRRRIIFRSDDDDDAVAIGSTNRADGRQAASYRGADLGEDIAGDGVTLRCAKNIEAIDRERDELEIVSSATGVGLRR